MVPEEITPLVPAVVGEKVADDQTCFILEILLKYMVIQVMAIFTEEIQDSCLSHYAVATIWSSCQCVKFEAFD